MRIYGLLTVLSICSFHTGPMRGHTGTLKKVGEHMGPEQDHIDPYGPTLCTQHRVLLVGMGWYSHGDGCYSQIGTEEVK